MIRLWLCSSNGGGTEEIGRQYDLQINLVTNSSVLSIANANGDFDRTGDSVGLLSVSTTEAMNGHSASLSFVATHPWGDRLRKCLLSQDMLLVEAIGPDGEWDTLFDGFVSDIHWSEEGSQNSYSHRFSVRFEGANRLINSAWENWQGLLNVNESKLGPVGDKLIKDWSVGVGTMDPAAMIKRIIEDGVGKLMDIEARGQNIAAGWMQTASTAGDWGSDPSFHLNIWLACDRILMSQGTLAGIIQGLVEPELHEFFLTYRDGKPTWVFRPHPFPGAPADGSTPADDARWNALVENPIALNNCVGATGSRNDARMSTVFQWAGAATNTKNGFDYYGKCYIGAWEHEHHVKKYGFRSRQIVTSLIGVSDDDGNPWLTTIPKKIVERVAWQDSPLPWLEQQSRHYPWLPSRVKGLHIGKVVWDWTAGEQLTGYLVSIQHDVRPTNNGVEAFTVLGLDRVHPGSTPSSYADDVRKFGDGLRKIQYVPVENGVVGKNIEKTDPPAQWAPPARAAKVLRPCAGGTETSQFSLWRVATQSAHNGLDIAAAFGTDIVSPVTGKVDVVSVGVAGKSGNYITILDTVTHYRHSLCHLFSVMPGLVSGVAVAAGQKVGSMGHTGHVIASRNGSGCHVHWTVRNPDGIPFDPKTLL